MANHAHKQIRDAVVTAVTGLVTTGANVFANRLYSLADVSLPALRIRLGQEDATPQSIHAPHVQERVLRLVVEVCAKSDTALADSIDQISKEVEIALSTALNISGVRVQPVYAGCDPQFEISDKPVSVKPLAFDLAFFTMNNAPDILI